jgi:methionyl-tRNA formyltransferase
MDSLRVGFAGTPDFAAQALTAILAAGAAVPLVLTQPDRPKGRGLQLTPSPVKELAIQHALPVLQPATLKPDAVRAEVLAYPLDVLVVAAYGLILPPAILAWPRYGCLNIHASRLPRWRGAAPIQRAIAAGDTTTGVTIMQMDAGLDTGPIITELEIPIESRETARTLHDKLATAGAGLLVDVLARLARGETLPALAQPESGATYAAKIERDETTLDWTLPAAVLDRLVRAFNPVPGAQTRWNDETVKVWEALFLPIASVARPGSVVAVGRDGIDVGCGEHVLRLVSLQPAAGRRMTAAAFAAGRSIVVGSRFGGDLAPA